MEILITNNKETIVKTDLENYKTDIMKCEKLKSIWKWIEVSYIDGTHLTNSNKRRVIVYEGKSILAEWTRFYEFSEDARDEIIQNISKDFGKELRK